MDAQHAICAGQLSHATRQTDTMCYKSAEFRCMARATPLPILKGCVLILPTATFSEMMSSTISGCPYQVGGCVLWPYLLDAGSGVETTSGCTVCRRISCSRTLGLCSLPLNSLAGSALGSSISE